MRFNNDSNLIDIQGVWCIQCGLDILLERDSEDDCAGFCKKNKIELELGKRIVLCGPPL